MIRVYATSLRRNQRISAAFAAGCGASILPPYPLKSGDVFMYGALRGLLPTLRQAQAEGRTWYYADNAYFGRDAYYRVTRNAMQHDGTGSSGQERWRRLGIEVKPWRKSGHHIVVCPPARLLAVILNIDADRWLKDTLGALAKHTSRQIRLRRKMSYVEATAPGGTPLSEDLRGAWALVTHSSNAAVEALLAGVPVFCTAPCAAARMGLADLAQIEAPVMTDDREQWAWNLAAAQWQLSEMRTGQCWAELNPQRSA